MSGTFQLTIHLFLQLAVILISCRLVGKLLRYLGQPQVVGEMVAGVLLGPSLLGLLTPDGQRWLFPVISQDGATHPSMAILYALSQVGLVLFMFLIGLELNVRLLNQHSREALAISLSGVLVPAVLGGFFGYLTGANSGLFASAIQPWQAAIFMASAMSITAFPVLARILYDAGHTQTRIGTLAISAAAVNDAMAWVLLACVIAAVKGSATIALLAAGGGLAYTLAMVFIGRPLFRGFERMTTRDEGVRPETLALALAILMACAWFTDLIGIYAVFGAFILGLVMPRGRFAEGVRRSVEPLTVSLLIPVFFVYSGLNTHLNLLVDSSLLGVAILTIIVAFACKGGGCLLAAKSVGATWRDSAAIGVLMNARGLMELMLANIALERGLITPAMFTILVLMAIVTTLAASPLYHLLYRPGTEPQRDPSEPDIAPIAEV